MGIPDNKLKEASQYAYLEANHWRDTAQITKDNYSSQKYICYLLSCELYLKSIIMFNGINITNEKYIHDLSCLIKKLNKKDLEFIKKNTNVDKCIINPITGEKLIFNSFEAEIKKIKNDFVKARYEYEQFINGKPIYLLIDFVQSLSDSLYIYVYQLMNTSNKK